MRAARHVEDLMHPVCLGYVRREIVDPSRKAALGAPPKRAMCLTAATPEAEIPRPRDPPIMDVPR